MSLPPPLTILNTLLTKITTIPLLPNTSPPQNALARVPVDSRHLIITLHVLFPSLLLPALDLLDRGLITRLILNTPTSIPAQQQQQRQQVYQVHSAQTPKRRPHRRGTESRAVKTYVVCLEAWNCTCAGFAFSVYERMEKDEGGGVGEQEGEGRGSFGGTSQVMGEGVPICKHLMACLLAERWEALGECVVERGVTREEMAAVMADV